jgi:hypothetical protein
VDFVKDDMRKAVDFSRVINQQLKQITGGYLESEDKVTFLRIFVLEQIVIINTR